MADKKQVRKSIMQLKRVETWQLFVILILVGFLAATFLRLNNIGMADRRQAVLAADKKGDRDEIDSRLYDLQRYVSAHMNTDTSVFYLEYQYKRDVQASVEKATTGDTQTSSINAEVDKICRSKVSGYGQAWIQCFTEELAKFPAAPDPETSLSLPDAELYRQEFAAPRWTPDFAGWSLVICGLIILVIIIRLVSLGILHLLLRRHYQSV